MAATAEYKMAMIQLKAETVLAHLWDKTDTITLAAGTFVSYHEETRGTNRVGVIEHYVGGRPYRAERRIERKPAAGECTCDHNAPCMHCYAAPKQPNVCRQPRTIRNDRSGETVATLLSDREAADAFARLHADKNHWLWFWLHKAVNEAKPTHQGGKDVTTALDFIADSFVVAVGYGLLRPMIRVHYKDQRFKFYLSAKGTVCLKSGRLLPGTQDPEGDEEYIGCLLRGRFSPARNDVTRRERPLTATEAEFLAKLGEDPVAFLAQCSKDMCRCCYCYAPLEDERSKAVGYGSICAGRYGLPWGEAKHMENAPSFAKAYNQTAHELLAGIRANPKDEQAWGVFGDWLEENGLPRPQPNLAKNPRLPRND
jgi:uncharacterized protein (TIGR02996 family)